jgi:hypothetical protein
LPDLAHSKLKKLDCFYSSGDLDSAQADRWIGWAAAG